MRRIAAEFLSDRHRWMAWVSSFALLAAGCSGGGGGAFSSPSSPVAQGGGIGGSGTTVAPVLAVSTGTSTAIQAAGVRWTTTSSTVVLDGQPATPSDLRVGMVVRVTGALAPGATQGQAATVTFDDELEGPVSEVAALSLDGQVKRLTILGQTVRIDAVATAFEGTTTSTIAVGDVVEVSGHRDDHGPITATRIEKTGDLALGVTEVEFHGVLNGLDAGAGRFMLGSIEVTFDGATTLRGGLAAIGLADGQDVEVEGVLVATSTVAASVIELEDASEPDVARAQLEGTIGAFAGSSSFRVRGQRIDASGATLAPANPALLANGVVVAVDGPIVNGVLLADTLSIRFAFGGDAVRIEAAVASAGSIDLGAATVTLLGVPIRSDGSTAFDDRRDQVAGFGLADIAAGDFLKVRGFLEADGSVTATHVDRHRPKKIKLHGCVDAFAFDPASEVGTLTVLGASVPTGAATAFGTSSTTAASFYAGLAVGAFVKVEDDVDGDETAIDTADEVEIGDAGASAAASSDPIELEGVIGSFIDLSQFRVGGQVVDASNATLDPNDPGQFANGVRVEVEGVIVDGVLVATELELD